MSQSSKNYTGLTHPKNSIKWMSKLGDAHDEIVPEPDENTNSTVQQDLLHVKNGNFIFQSLLRRIPDYKYLVANNIEMPDESYPTLKLNFD